MTDGSNASAASVGVPSRTATEQRVALRTRRLVLEVARRHFGEPARAVVECAGGLTNAVYQLKVSQGAFIIRTHENATKIQDYLKEQWAMAAARDAGVPVPHVLEVGNLEDGRAYMIAERVLGLEGCAVADRLSVVKQMGQAAARLHAVRTHGFGSVFDWSANSLSKHATWAGYLEDGFGTEARIEMLLKHRVIGRRQARWLRSEASTLAKTRRRPNLQHGDLRLKNVIVQPKSGRIAAIIDWEACVSMPGPAWDLSLALHDLGLDEKEAFLEGYGMAPKAFAKTLDAIRCFNMLNYAHAVHSAALRQDDRRLAWFRARLAGELDLTHP